MFLWMSVYLFIGLSVYLPVCLFHCLSVCLPHYACTAYLTSGDIFEIYLQGSKLTLVGLFCHVSEKRDLRALALGFASSFGNFRFRWDRLYVCSSGRVQSCLFV